MKKLLIFILFITSLAGFYSCDKPTERQQEADALFQKITKIYTLHEDGSVDYQYKHELDLHSYYAFNSLYGETFIVYNPEFQNVEVNQSVTETAEGKMVPSPENAYNEVLPGFASGAPPYHHLREMVVTHTALEKNSTILLDYKIESNPEYMPFLMENEVLAKNSPVRKLVIKVRFPEKKELNYKILNAKENLNIAKFGELKEYKWVFEDIPALKHEDQQPEYGQHLPRLMFSTEQWTGAYQDLTGELSENLPESATISISEAANDSKNRMDSILAIQDIVVNHINHFNIPFEHTGFRVRSNEQVLEDNGGTTLEKTWLLTCLLQEMGVNATLISIIPSEFFEESMGNLKSTEKYYVEFPHKNETIYLSAINGNQINARYRLASEVNLLLDPGNSTPKWIKPRQKESKLSIEGNLKLTNNNRLTGTVDAQFQYCENPYLTIQRNENSVKTLLAPGFNIPDITRYQTEQVSPEMSLIQYIINQKLNPETQGEYWVMQIPEINTGLDQWHTDILPEKRTTPLEPGWPVNISFTYSIDKPENIELLTDDMEISEKNEAGDLTIRIETDGDQVRIERKLEISEKMIQPDIYQDFRKLMNIWNKPNHKKLVFRNR